jgi:hypothetical protein
MKWWRRWHEWQLERWRMRMAMEIMYQNAYLSREDGYRYPRCDVDGNKDECGI